MIIVTGANGQLASCVKDILKDEAIYLSKNDFDISNQSSVDELFTKFNPTVLINCAAYTQVDKSENEKELAEKVNANAVQLVADKCSKSNCKLIHISTDYVFDGTKNTPYHESDETAPSGVYGQTKLAGEQAVVKANGVYAILRTSWLYSEYGKNFVKTMKDLTTTKEALNVVYDQVGCPTYAPDLAKAIVAIIPKLNKVNSGTYHFCNTGVASWYDLTREIQNFYNTNCTINPIESHQYPTPVKRPHYSVLSTDKIRNTFNIQIPYWKESLITCLKKLSS